MRRRRGQLQTIEPILVVITITVLLLVGGAYFLRASSGVQEQRQEAIDARDDLALLERVVSLPELACSGPASANRLCVDLVKARAFSALISANESLRVTYFPILGATNLTLRVVDFEDGTARDLPLYDSSRNTTQSRATRTYMTVFDPATGEVRLGMLELRRSVG